MWHATRTKPAVRSRAHRSEPAPDVLSDGLAASGSMMDPLGSDALGSTSACVQTKGDPSVQRYTSEEDVEEEGGIQRMGEEEEAQAKVQRMGEEEEAQAKVQRMGDDEEAQAKVQRDEEDPATPSAASAPGATDEEAQAKVQRDDDDSASQSADSAPAASDDDVQTKAAGAPPAPNLGAVVRQATSGGSVGLPHLSQIQSSFGGYDVSDVKAHVGGPAESANESLHAKAFASGDKVAFKDAPDLHTAAHEAAHVVQQRGGVQLKGNLGHEGDRYERNADAVADRVVQGESAADLLEPFAGAVQAAAAQKKATK